MEEINGRLLNWASILETTTREQAERTAAMPFIYPHLALMPDAHLGKGATVGSVIPTEGAIIPAAVGVDIGCGMMAVRTQFTATDLAGRPLDVLHGQIARAIPLSAGRYNTKVRDTTAPRVEELRAMPGAAQADTAARNWPLQVGSLGSGNHFIEVSLDEADRVWLFLHSGSRGVGNKLASRHIRVAQEQCRARSIELADRDLAYLVEGEPEFDAYIEALRWAQRFAFLNREEMMDRVVDQVGRFFSGHGVRTDVERLETINCFAGETAVITRTGTRPIEALAGGEHELLTVDGQWVKAPVRSFGRQEVAEVVLSRSGVTTSIRATAEHRWLLRSRRGHEYETTTAELQPGDRLQFTFPVRPDALHVDRLSAARGFVYGDGSPAGARSRANFCGATRPSLDSSPSELFGWLAGYFAAAGDVDKTGRPTMSSASREDLEFVRTACQAIGVGTFGIRSRLRSGYGRTPTPLHVVGLMRGDLDPEFFLLPEHRARYEAGRGAAERRGWNVVSVRPTGETTEVYCAVVEGTHSFALADNILTRNCHHNYTEREEHYGREVWLSRKGAISAREGQGGLIPGSMGTASYVVVGKGNVPALMSSPHGAGRNHSRTAARKLFTRADLDQRMTGIAWGHSNAFLDEHPDAYKPIDQVMADAADLVEVRHTLRQIVNVKGD
jgi:RNA-splicing ligase RtcB